MGHSGLPPVPARPGQVVQLSGETAPDLKLINEAKIIVCTAKRWDAISRRWRQRKAVQAVTLFVVDDMHFLGGDVGPTMEVIISRMRFISTQKQQKEDGSHAEAEEKRMRTNTAKKKKRKNKKYTNKDNITTRFIGVIVYVGFIVFVGVIYPVHGPIVGVQN